MQSYGGPKLWESQLWEFRDSHLDAGLMERCRVYYKGEGGGCPQVQATVSLVSPSLLVARFNTKVLQLCTKQLVAWFVQAHVSK
jgi:hypothetical protein